MTDQRTERTIVDATPDACYAIVADVGRYPEWASEIDEADVLTLDEHGRPLDVRFVASAWGRLTRYTLRYDHSDAPLRLAWKLVEGDMVTCLDGWYRFTAVADDITEVEYSLVAELQVPLPGFVKRRAESRIIRNALAELGARLRATAA
ncbi:MAG: SRPBCC family protein [Actinomycetota bacterium]|nr:SRPBCC family protein [Actinomycetota bacterium]